MLALIVALVLSPIQLDTLFIVAVALLLGAATPMLLWPEVATLVVVFLLYTNIPAIAYQLHGLPQFVAASFIFLLAVPLAHYVLLRREKPTVDRTFQLMVVFLAALLLSALFARDASIASQRIQTYVVEGLALYWLIVNVVRRLPTLRRVITTLLVAASLLGGLGLYQSVTGDYHQQFGGLAQRQLKFEYKEDRNAPGQEGPRMYQSDRAEGPIGSVNRYAQIMIVLLPLALFPVPGRALPTDALLGGNRRNADFKRNATYLLARSDSDTRGAPDRGRVHEVDPTNPSRGEHRVGSDLYPSGRSSSGRAHREYRHGQKSRRGHSLSGSGRRNSGASDRNARGVQRVR